MIGWPRMELILAARDRGHGAAAAEQVAEYAKRDDPE